MTYKNNDTIIGQNFAQRKAGTVIMSNLTGLHFIRCNLTNVFIQPTWTTEDCNIYQGDYVDEIILDPIDEEITIAVDKIAELSFKYPDKVSAKLKGKVDKTTTEGLLSADGKPVSIEAPEGWKK